MILNLITSTMLRYLGIFSSLDVRGKEITIEVVSILDCFNGENASDFKSQFSVLNKDNFSIKGSYQLIHLDLMAKCFKWRVVVSENGKNKLLIGLTLCFKN